MKIEEVYCDRCKKEIKEHKTALIKFEDDLNEGFIIQNY